MSSINQWEKPEHNYSGLYTYAQGPQQDFHLNNKPYIYRSAFKYKYEDMDKPSTMVSDSILNDRIKLKLNAPYSKDGLAKLKSAQKELENSKKELIHTRLLEEGDALSQQGKMLKDTPLGQDAGNPPTYSTSSYKDTQVLGENNSFGLPEGYNLSFNVEQYAPPSKITIKGGSSNSNSSSITTPINQSGLSEYSQNFLDKWGLREDFNNFNKGGYNPEKKQLAGDDSMEDAFRMLQNSMSSINIKGRKVPKQLQEALVSQIYREQGINLKDILSNRSDGIHDDMIKRKDGSNRVNGGVISYNDTRLTNKDGDGYLDRLNMWKNGQLSNIPSRADFEINHLLYDMEKHRPKQYKKLINLLDNPNSTTEDFIKVFDDSIGWVGASFQKTFTPKINKTIANGRRDIAYARKLFNQI